MRNFLDTLTGRANVGAPKEFAVIGLGRFGSSVAMTLVERGHTVLGIDQSAELVQRYSDVITQTARLDSTDETALKEVDIQSYDTVVVAIGSDLEANILTVAALRSLGIRRVVCKAQTRKHREILLSLGADKVALPEYEAGQQLAVELSLPLIVARIELDSETEVSELRVPAAMVGHTIEETGVTVRYGLQVLAVKTDSGVEVAPKASHRLKKNDLLIVLGASDRIGSFAGA